MFKVGQMFTGRDALIGADVYVMRDQYLTPAAQHFNSCRDQSTALSREGGGRAARPWRKESGGELQCAASSKYTVYQRRVWKAI